MTAPHPPTRLPDLPRCHDLAERIRIILERNPLAFPDVMREAPLRVVAGNEFRTVHEHDGTVRVRRLLDWDDDDAPGSEMIVFAGSFLTADDRESPDELDAPTMLAWRLLEDLCDMADAYEARHPPPAATIRAHDLAAITDDALAANPQFFPPWLMELLAQGAFVIDKPPEWDDTGASIGFFEETAAGSRVVIVAPNLLDGADEYGDAWVHREVLITLCHEFEHHYGNVRGYDPLGDREDFFDRLGQ
ncbi:MAG: hypothetical protein AB7S36_02175 [Planctomycetota bacterium]